jgi:hypothetical protein
MKGVGGGSNISLKKQYLRRQWALIILLLYVNPFSTKRMEFLFPPICIFGLINSGKSKYFFVLLIGIY